MTELYWQATQKDVTLKEAINLIHQKSSHYLDNAIGLIYSLQRCCFVKINGENIEEPPKENGEENIDIGSIFEARIFNKNLELRWLNKKSGRGKGVLISDTEIDLCLGGLSETIEILSTQKQRYLLWGEVRRDFPITNTEWSKLMSSRIGFLYAPQKLKDRCYLETCEYFQEDKYGNISVV